MVWNCVLNEFLNSSSDISGLNMSYKRRFLIKVLNNFLNSVTKFPVERINEKRMFLNAVLNEFTVG